ncbi:uncharacterized protein MONBRDRAFT_26179 [Monosiga brevicollis MX1]|uniref:Uncharacterized protein n=1 Tax=Monosiga brevicollis TaxID=81824 RepID=A9V1L0_MONBE|nr:uncharacterized protein MONBRDRAFT_26179 [Monosiga brevicollis MX1]EDQ88586.1 predicted protein [Monosiga brevicollis MX1]|eukprot:XP_001746690.1 hypothetical protein [Monosiga brevicollis MX1]
MTLTAVQLRVEPSEVAMAVYALVAYFILYFVFLSNQSATSQLLVRKYKKRQEKFVKYYNTKDPSQLTADRAVGNMLEQMPVFLTGYFAAMVTAAMAGESFRWVNYAAFAYTASRSMYLVAFKNNASAAGIKPGILLATLPGYVVILYHFYFAVTTVTAM